MTACASRRHVNIRGMAARSTTHDLPAAADLASIVLAAPAQSKNRSHDARSVLLLAIVVAVLVMVVAAMWGLAVRTDVSAKPSVTPISAGQGAQASSERSSRSSVAPHKRHKSAAAASGTAAADTAAGAGSTTATLTRDAAAHVALLVGRITATPDAQSGTVVVRAAVKNVGALPLATEEPARLLVMIDDHVAGSVALGRLGPRGARTTYAVTAQHCSAGRHAVTVIADATAQIAGADTSGSTRTADLTFDCPY
ncbi:MAG: hypothetical protein JWN41_635 [Thermoleophilia bacterium]|nr:hypothetical protein [Thermoleophilia bacterium]